MDRAAYDRRAAQVLQDRRIAFIGCGVMAEAIMAVLLRGELVTADQLRGSEPVAARRQELRERYGIDVMADNKEAVRDADLVMLTVKPQVIEAVMRDISGALREDQIVVSIVPGVTLKRLARGLGHPAVVRSMPNTPAQIGYGATVWIAAPSVGAAGRELVGTVFGAMGVSVPVETEDAIDMATALSGTGPAYVFLVMESLIDAGVHLGFARRVAEELVQQTMLGSVLFARDSGRHPAERRNMVTTPGGTTAAALYEMEKGGLRTVIARAVWAAYRRAQGLGRGTGHTGPGRLG